jgi:glycopeptide antibiotics resistance protein
MIDGSVIWIAWPVVAGLVVFWQMRRSGRPAPRAGARRIQWLRMMVAVALATYAWWICSVAFFPLPLGDSVATSGAAFAGRAWVNLVPFRELFRALPRMGAMQIIREFGGNVLLFVPFTLAGPLVWARLRTWRWPLAAGLGGSLAIELIQLALSGLVGFPYRQTDVDDVILNTLGAFLGYAVSLVVIALARRVSRRTPADVSPE